MAKKGYVFYDGESLINGQPIVGIATGFGKNSANKKTGSVIQTWILPKEIDPCKSTKTGEDECVCGNCKHRRVNFNSCYVLIHQAPQNVWNYWKKGVYADYDENAFVGKVLRIGSYGDPAAIPLDIWENLVTIISGHTGYTHLWKTCDPAYKKILMASCDTVKEKREASKKGWNTFRIRAKNGKLDRNEMLCSNEKLGLQCICCGKCHGTMESKQHIVTTVHGVKGYSSLRRFWNG